MSSFPTGYKRWVLNYDLRNCSGNLCPPNTLCMRPEYAYYPTHCVHINNVDDVDQHLSTGPIYLCNDGIAQYITQGMLVIVLFSLFLWRSSSKKVSDNKKDKKNPSICESITANLELLTPPRLNFPTLLREGNDQPANNSQFSTNSLSTSKSAFL
uniref:Uncharacterized protein n=1 Tax=Meloidogyne javanica TaxID=6303 RepID=A0A915LR78_MELJA